MKPAEEIITGLRIMALTVSGSSFLIVYSTSWAQVIRSGVFLTKWATITVRWIKMDDPYCQRLIGRSSFPASRYGGGASGTPVERAVGGQDLVFEGTPRLTVILPRHFHRCLGSFRPAAQEKHSIHTGKLQQVLRVAEGGRV